MARHTPGGWKVMFGGMDQDDYFTVGNGERAVCGFAIGEDSGPPMSHAEMVANAHLIAAAPAMRAALEAISLRVAAVWPSDVVELMMSAMRQADGLKRREAMPDGEAP